VETNSPRNSRRARLHTKGRGPVLPAPSPLTSVVSAICLKKLFEVVRPEGPNYRELARRAKRVRVRSTARHHPCNTECVGLK
jgi:hypothetical protein